jgi:hypothetical protein
LDDLYTALFTDNPAVFHPFVFPTIALPIFDWAKDFGAKQSVTLWLKRPVINGFRLLNLTMRPGADLLRRGNGNTDRTERSRVFGFLEQVENAIQRHPPSLSASNYTRVCVHTYVYLGRIF